MKTAVAADEPDDPNYQLEIRALTSTATSGRTNATITLRHGGRHTTWPLAEFTINSRGIVLYDTSPLDLEAIAERLLHEVFVGGACPSASHRVDRAKLAKLIADIRASGEERS